MKITVSSLILSLLIFTQAYGQSQSDMLERVLGSVVTVTVESVDDGNMLLGFRGENRSVQAAYDASLDLGEAYGSGSGFIIERNGQKYVITNSHVIESASGEPGSIIVYSIDRSRYEMELVGGDTFYDFAVLAFIDNPGSEIVAVDFKTDEPRIGEQVFAVGNPLGEYPYTISEGIIGGMNRVRGGSTGKFGFLQSTATVIWGNSGGPLFDVNGDVIGINSQIALTRRNDQIFIQPQINFALEAEISNRLTNDILNNNGRVRRAYLGIELSDIYQRRTIFGRETLQRNQEGPQITGLLEGSVAARELPQYLHSEIRAINGTSVRNIEEALGEFEKTRPGETVTLDINLGGETRQVSFNTEELNPERNTKIAEQLAKYDSDLHLSEIDGNKVMLAYQGSSWDVAGAGIESTFWRVQSINDLATSIRFAGMYGMVDIVVGQQGGQTQRLRMNLSGRSDQVNRVLWY